MTMQPIATSITPINSLTSVIFLNMLQAGAEQVIANESQLNQLNVYPVTDRDTGSNMAALMRYLLAQSYSSAALPVLIAEVADAALVGACGNSGMIFSAFLDGFASGRADIQNNLFSTHSFLSCLRLAVDQAYFSVSVPVEGTMLTIMRAFLKTFEEVSLQSEDFIFILERCMAQAEVALRDTEHQLAVLEENHVIDAGALGFFLFVQGMYEYLIHPGERFIAENHLPDNFNEHAHENNSAEEQSAYAFCMETLLRAANLNIDEAKVKLAACADCIVINKSPNYTKIHLHTNDIQFVTQYLKQFGIIQHQKIDNMRKQWEISHERKHRVALITDSTADIPDDWILNEQIHVIPTQVRLGEHALLDRMTVGLDEIYQVMKETGVEAKSATPSVEVVSRYLRYLSTHYDAAIVFSVSSKLSGTFQLLKKQASEINAIPIEVIDTETISAAQGLLVMAAAKYLAAGDDQATVVKKINALKEDTHLFVVVNEWETLTKSGRVPHSFGLLAKWVNLKPILAFKEKGKLSVAGFSIGKNMAWRRLLKLLTEKMSQCEMHSFAIVHTAALDEAKKFAAFLEHRLGIKIDFIREASAAIGLHAGRGCIALAASPAYLR